jgi:hypothetical protein
MTQISMPTISFLLPTYLVGASSHEGYQRAPLLLRQVVH